MSQVPDVNELLQNANEEEAISNSALQVLTGVVDIGAQIQQGLGISADDVTASEVVLVTVMPDDSGSIRMAGNTQNVRDGHNMVIEAFAGAKNKDSVLLHTRYLNGEVLNPYRPLDQAEAMDQQNYNPMQGTPLYDQTVVLLGTVLAKSQEFTDIGVPVRTITLLVTDGADEHSMQNTAGDVETIVRDMLMSENHIIAAMGVDNGYTDFWEIFREMGIPDQWVLTTDKDDPSSIRKAFQVFSQSAVRASQNAASFSQAAMGGFGTP